MTENKYFSSTDKPTTFAHPGWRVAYTILSCGAIGITLSSGTSLFVGLMMLASGLLFDYAKFTPTTKFRKIAKTIGGCWSAAVFIFNLLATFGALTVVKANEPNQYDIEVASFPFFVGNKFSANWFWAVISIVCIILTVVDWVSEVRGWKEVKRVQTQHFKPPRQKLLQYLK
ncbi:hypothetical protein LJK87_00145 [Paenibacillus sp. P25]|nr:hypothetical protein LJK87_00145 [Paenibacillus sp. P25]